MKFRVDDEVVVVAGADKGHRGKIISLDRVKNKVIVEGAALVYKHVRKSAKNPAGGRLNKSMPIAASNVALVDPSTGKPTKIGYRYTDDGSKERYAKSSGKTIDKINSANTKYAKK